MKVAPEKIELFDDRVIVKCDNFEEKTKGGIILPPNTKEKEKPRTGTIINLGYQANDDRKRGSILSLGDRVLFGKYAGIEMEDELGDDFHVIMRAQDIIGRINGVEQ